MGFGGGTCKKMAFEGKGGHVKHFSKTLKWHYVLIPKNLL